ncbi:uncharacterized protein LOC109815107 isoform X2 [Cajanus cajan]|uniref:uncharacterized protein LOC109815107 isoform X2 n=1 Tax=Cajanus cajan TaxID=3821 RepID=UPI0010FB1A9E|nr:uncharacterized protein LOC109815107 isoform X2 [Cajanus cajan]
MQNFTTKIVNLMKAERLFQSQGGPIIISQKENEYGPDERQFGAPGKIDIKVKFSDDFAILLFHYDGRTSEWDQFEWSRNAIHISARKQAKWYINLVKKHGLEISQPGLEPNNGLTWEMTKRRGDKEVHMITEEKPGWCSDPHLPPCAAMI